MEHAEVMSRSELFEHMRSGAVVVTGNIRLSRSLLAEFERMLADADHLVWRTPMVLPYAAWLRELREGAALRGERVPHRLLTAGQETQLWEAAIRRDGPGLLSAAATARTAKRSWQRIRDWRIDPESPEFGMQESTRAFRRWAGRFTAVCRARELVTAAGLESDILRLLGERALDAPNRIILVGFYELTPSQHELLSAFRDTGCEVSRVTLAGSGGGCRRTEARDEEHELQLAAAWARRCLEENPEGRVGIVVPDLVTHRDAMAGHLRAQLSPASLLPGKAAAQRSWNISLGRSLAGYPVIEAALMLLHLMNRVVRLDLLGPLLVSPWWALPRARDRQRHELSRRALLDARLRERGEPRLTLRTVQHFADGADKTGAPTPGRSKRLARTLGALVEEQGSQPASAGSGEWALRFSRWLGTAGWCAGAALDSETFQVVERWQGLLSEFSTLDDFAGPLSRSAAVGLLGRMAREALFQPKADEVSVQVLGLYEANEQQFDALWVTGLHDAQWPPSPSPDPFIPSALQRRHRLPGGNPQWELRRARHMMRQWEGAARHVIFSHPGRSGDAELKGSPLLESYERVPAGELTPAGDGPWLERVQRSAVLQSPPRHQLPGMTEEQAAGGVRILKSFSACPFKALAEHRLGAWPLERPMPGLDARRRGSLLHRALELFWRDLVSRDALLALGASTLGQRAEAAVKGAVDELARRNPLTLGRRFAAIETRRLVNLLAAWLEVEKQRAPFRIVALEREASVVIGGLSLRVIVDRIDELEDGSLLIIDYKTGRVSPAGWFGERPEDPQLPLYSLTAGEDLIAGVVFAQLRAGETRFQGVVRSDLVLPGVPPARRGPLRDAMEEWPAVLREWSRMLASLAAQFRAGHAQVDPRAGLRTCAETYCELAPLCRIHTAAPAGARNP